MGHFVDPVAHGCLCIRVSVKRGKSRIDDLGVLPFMVGGSSKRRVHDDQVEPFVRYFYVELGGGFLAGATGSKRWVGSVDEHHLAE